MRSKLVLASCLLVAALGQAQTHAKPMDDSMLDKVTAAGVTANVAHGVVNFAGQAQTPNGLVSAAGTLSTQTAPLNSSSLGTLTINGSAQQNLSSLININAVNSKINVLLNLNININSTVGTVTQANLNGKH